MKKQETRNKKQGNRDHSCFLFRVSCSSRGFTLVELMVSVGIFVFMTAVLVAKYGNFNQSVLLTNLAYDVAITLRTAQTYGLSVKPGQAPGGVTLGPDVFKTAFGVNFNGQGSITCSDYNNVKFMMFADTDLDGLYRCSPIPEPIIGNYNLKRGAYISDLCAGSTSNCVGSTRLDITFKRPDPEAIICHNGTCGSTYAEITLKDPSGSERKIAVHQNGRIEVKE